MKLGELSSGTLIMLIVAVVLVVLLIVLIVVTINVLKKPTENENYTKKEYTSYKSDEDESEKKSRPSIFDEDDEDDNDKDEIKKSKKDSLDKFKPENEAAHESDIEEAPNEDDTDTAEDVEEEEDEGDITEVLKSTIEADEAEAEEKVKEEVAERFFKSENKESVKEDTAKEDETEANEEDVKNYTSIHDRKVQLEFSSLFDHRDDDVTNDTIDVSKQVKDAKTMEEKYGKYKPSEENDSAFVDNSFTIEKGQDTTFDSAFTDSAFSDTVEEEDNSLLGMKPYKDEGKITVNPVNQVNINAVNSDIIADSVDLGAKTASADEMKAFLSNNPVPKKKNKKMKKGEALFEQKFREETKRGEIQGADYFWYNNQDIENLARKEDMYFYCKYFNDPDKAVLPLIIEMYDCAFVRTEEIERIAYGIKFKAMGMREILSAKENISFDRSEATKEPTEEDKQEIYEKWCGYVDNFLKIIVINAPDNIKEEIKLQLYHYGHNDAETLLFCPDEPDDDEDD